MGEGDQQAAQVAAGDGHVVGGDLLPTGKVDGVDEVGKFDEVGEVGEGAGATAVIQIHRVHHPPIRPESQGIAADVDAAFRVASAPGEGVRGVGDGLQQQAAVKPDVAGGVVHFGPGFVPDGQRLVVQEVQTDVFQNVQRGVVDLLNLVGGQDFGRRERVARLAERGG